LKVRRREGGRAGNSGGEMPFGGGSGGGVTVQPVAFLVVGQGQVRLLPVDRNAMLDRLIDLTPQVISQIQGMLKRDRYREMPPERSYS